MFITDRNYHFHTSGLRQSGPHQSEGDRTRVKGQPRMDTQDPAHTSCGSHSPGHLRLLAPPWALVVQRGKASQSLAVPRPGPVRPCMGWGVGGSWELLLAVLASLEGGGSLAALGRKKEASLLCPRMAPMALFPGCPQLGGATMASWPVGAAKAPL